MAKVIGIDLGTSNSACAVMEHGRPAIIPSAEGTSIGGKAFPSYVAFTKDGQLLVGEPARRQAATNPEGTVQAAKRKMGTDHVYRIYGKEYTPQQISAFILQKVKRDAEAYLGEPVKEVVITVPAYFNDNQRQATKDAGSIAGLEVLRIINEPTAACLAYGLDKAGKEQKILVFDLGGGTLDVTIMDMAQGVFEVKSTSGDTQLGGTDMDLALVDYIAGEFKKESGIDVRSDKMASQRIREAAEKAKIELSNVLETDINLPFITADASGPKHLTMKLTRATLEQIIGPIISRCRAPVEHALSDAKLKPAEIDKIILVGGPTRMPIVQRFVEETVGKKVERGVDPMECVAMGASIQAAIIKGEVKDVLLLDVTPLSMGIETMGGVFTKLIERNTTIPTRKSQIFSTADDNQSAVTVRVLQGERPMAGDNVELGRFDLVGIPPAPRGVPQVEVAFDIDANGIVHVSAKDLGTGKEQSIKISAPEKLSKDEIEKMVKQAEQFAEADKKRKETAEAKNQADQLVYATEKSLKDLGDKVGQSDRLAIERALGDLKEAIKSDDAGRIKQASEALTQVSHKLAEEVYKKAQAEGGAKGAQPGPQPSPEEPANKPGGKDNVVDAEFKVEDDKK
ncbi:MAG: molecular chaperone DnaK [Candidatus Omnitrophica bacterium CG11_big_fil_rev_8_21_14_0_20_63_9]|nr:MAG: molecular chaperone DnaK [Candidatus Omnitrophica bacterium CG11_big_fil_rev_8_21_14_0_20_63_9]